MGQPPYPPSKGGLVRASIEDVCKSELPARVDVGYNTEVTYILHYNFNYAFLS